MLGWEGRLALVASRIRPGESVLDVGAGTMALRDRLPPRCIYVPLDRSEPAGGIGCDLDADAPLPVLTRRFDVAVVSGVLEHLDMPGRALEWALDQARWVILTYSPVDLAPARGEWRNALSREDVAALVEQLGGVCIEVGIWQDHCVYEATRCAPLW